MYAIHDTFKQLNVLFGGRFQIELRVTTHNGVESPREVRLRCDAAGAMRVIRTGTELTFEGDNLEVPEKARVVENRLKLQVTSYGDAQRQLGFSEKEWYELGNGLNAADFAARLAFVWAKRHGFKRLD